MLIEGSNLITLNRPQVNTYPPSDKTSDGMQLKNSSAISIFAADIEGTLLNGIHLIQTTGSFVNYALGQGQGSTTNNLNVDTGSFQNVFVGYNVFLTAHIDPTAQWMGNLFFGEWDFTGPVGLGLWTNNINNTYACLAQGLCVRTDGSLTITGIKANSGTRFVCVDTTGKLVSQTTPCSGT